MSVRKGRACLRDQSGKRRAWREKRIETGLGNQDVGVFDQLLKRIGRGKSDRNLKKKKAKAFGQHI